MEYPLDKKKIKYICITHSNTSFYHDGPAAKSDYF